MNEFVVMLTQLGKRKLTAAALAGTKMTFKTFLSGDGNGETVTPEASQTALIHEIYRDTVHSVCADPENPNQIRIEHLIGKETGGFMIREIGILDADGDLVIVGSFPATYKPTLSEGTARDLLIRLQMAFDDPQRIMPILSPDYIYASKGFVENRANTLKTEILAYYATIERKGVVELETDAETLAMNDSKRAVTPKSLTELMKKKSETTHSHILNDMGLFEGFMMPFSGEFIGKNPLNPKTGKADTLWQICDGTNGTPDLRDRFIMAAGTVYHAGTKGGNSEHAHVSKSLTSGSTVLTIAQIPPHSHTYEFYPDRQTINASTEGSCPKWKTKGTTNSGSSGSGIGHSHTIAEHSTNNANHTPPYYSLAFVMKMS